MKKIFAAIAILFSVAFLLSFTVQKKDKINWISLNELDALYAKEPRPVIIDIYTDWCGWCKEMDRTTYNHEKLADYINKHYYAVKYNAESRETVTFNDKQFKYIPQYKTNELALYLTGGQLAYPTTVLMSGTDGQPAPFQGYMRPKQMEGPLKYFGEKANEIGTYVEFNKKLHTEW